MAETVCAAMSFDAVPAERGAASIPPGAVGASRRGVTRAAFGPAGITPTPDRRCAGRRDHLDPDGSPAWRSGS